LRSRLIRAARGLKTVQGDGAGDLAGSGLLLLHFDEKTEAW